MKNYKYVVPVLLVAGMAAGWYNMIDSVQGDQKKHAEYIRQADDYLKRDIIVDALEKYNQALEIEDTLAVRMKIEKVYLESGQEDEAETYAETIMQKYHGDSQIYECMMEYYIQNEMYPESFLIYDKAAAAGAMSAKLKELKSSIQYQYMIQMDGYTEVSSFVNGVCAVAADGDKGYVTESGSKLVFDDYEDITDFMGEFAFVKVKASEGKKAEWEMIDSSGNKRRVLPEDVDPDGIQSVGNFSGGVYPIETKQGSYSYYKENGALWKDGFSFAGTFWDGYLVVLDGTGYHFMNNKGEQSGGSFEKIAMDELSVGMRQKRFFGMNGNAYQMYTDSGKAVGSGSWQDAVPFSETGKYAAVENDGKWGFVDTKGNMVIEPQYEAARSFSYGFAAVKSNGKWGFIDTKGKMCIDPVFDEAKDMNSKGNVFIKQNGIWSLLSLYCYNYK